MLEHLEPQNEVESVKSASTSSMGAETVDPGLAPCAKRARFAPPSTTAHAVEGEVAELIGRARAAQRVIEDATQESIDLIIRAITFAVCREPIAEEIARICVKETQLGNFEGKLAKIKTKTRAALLDIIDDRSVGEIGRDKERELVLIAKPVGVVGATSPSTNPEATPVIKAINAIKGRNAIVIAPHPRAKRTNKIIVDYMRAALETIGYPADLIVNIDEPTKPKVEALMRQCDLAWATGGCAMVRRAYSSGTPALGVGQGNACIYIDRSADLSLAADCIRRSKTFDLAASCSSDNCLLADKRVYNDLVAELQKQGGYVVEHERDKESLATVIWTPTGALNASAVVKPATEIARLAGFSIPSDRTFLIIKEDSVGPSFPFSGEKLSVVLALFKVDGVDEAIRLTNEIHHYQGQGHSAGVFSTCKDTSLKFAVGTQTSRVMVNQPQSLSNSGALWNGMRQTLSLGCGTWGGTSTTENVYWRHLVNITYMSSPLETPKQIPGDEELFRGVPMEAIMKAAP